MPRRQTGNDDLPVHPLHQLGAEVALAERHALLQRVSLHPASLRREVIKHSLNGVRASSIAAHLRIPLSDIHAIMETFNEFADEQAL